MTKYKYHIIACVLLLLVLLAIIFRGKKKPVQSAPVSPPAPANTSPLHIVTDNNDSFPLKKGSSGENVKYLQRALNMINDKRKPGELVFPPLTVDGSLGQGTYERVLTLVGASWFPVTQDMFNKIMAKSRE